MPSWEDRFPFIGASGRKQLQDRLQACWPSIAAGLGLSLEALAQAKRLGCGNYGCTYLVPGLPPDRSVLKVTTDNLEQHTVKLLLDWQEAKPPGIVKYSGIWQLGKCSVLPRMRSFYYRTAPRGYPPQSYYAPYRGPGAPYRPVWLIQREELPDVMPELERRGLKQAALKQVLIKLQYWALDRAVDWGAPGAQKLSNALRIPEDEIRGLLAPFHGIYLMEALDWLMERGIGFYDFGKIANLGWREGTGLVIRDIGFASAGMELDADPAVLGTLQTRRNWWG